MLQIEGLTRRFGDTLAVDALTLTVDRGELLSLLGPSGCGKTTTLRMIAGFEEPTSGSVRVDGRDLTHLSPQQRGVGMVFQSYALFPHLDVWENVAFGLRARGTARAEIPARVQRALERVELGGYGKRRVQALSGGQQQRVALARALAPEPPLLLLDEPLSNLDAALRERTRAELRTLLKSLGMTAVFVTHDQEEAFALSDRVALLDRGRLQQVGTPEALYGRPANPFVASFLGRASFLEATTRGGGAFQLALGPTWQAESGLPAGAPARILARPEMLHLAVEGIPGRVTDRRFAGAATFYHVVAGEVELLVQGSPGEAAVGDEVRVAPRPGAPLIAFPAGQG